MNYFNAKGQLTDEGIALYIDALKLNKLDQVPDKVRDYVADHPKVQQEIADLYGIVGELDYAEKGTHPTLKTNINQGTRMRKLIVRLAVAAVLLLTCFFAYRQMSGPSPSDSPGIVQEDNNESQEQEATPKAPTPNQESANEEQKIAQQEPQTPPAKDNTEAPETTPEPQAPPQEQLASNEDLEALVGTIYRSDEGFMIQSPRPGIRVKQGLAMRFIWSGFQDDTRIRLIILNGEDEVLNQMIDHTFIWQNDAAPGVYYFKLETEDDLLYVGKFTVVE